MNEWFQQLRSLPEMGHCWPALPISCPQCSPINPSWLISSNNLQWVFSANPAVVPPSLPYPPFLLFPHTAHPKSDFLSLEMGSWLLCLFQTRRNSWNNGVTDAAEAQEMMDSPGWRLRLESQSIYGNKLHSPLKSHSRGITEAPGCAGDFQRCSEEF